MADAFPRLTAGDTRQFTVTYSAAPSTPVLTIWTGSGAGSVVSTQAMVASSSTAFYAFVRVDTPGYYQWLAVASFTSGPVLLPPGNQGLFKVVDGTPG